jgi:hypothetical protein
MTRLVIDRAGFLAGLSEKPREDVPIPELQAGAVIPVWGMTARERTAFEKQFAGKNGNTIDARVQEFRERLVVACCKDDAGQPIFLPEDVSAIGSKRADVLERIVNAAQRLSGFTKEDIEATVGN